MSHDVWFEWNKEMMDTSTIVSPWQGEVEIMFPIYECEDHGCLFLAELLTRSNETSCPIWTVAKNLSNGFRK